MEKNNDIQPGRLLAMSGSYWQACALHAGVKLGVFTLLADRQCTAAELAVQLDASVRGMELLLNALAAMGLLVKEDGRFIDTVESATLLNREAPRYVGYMIMHHHHLMDGWAQLDGAVRSGRPVTKRSHGEERERESFQMGMFNLAMAIAPEIAGAIKLCGRRRLLDLGGGPGTHAVHFCLANPGLEATVFDRPTTEPFARRTAERFEVADRVSFVAGDFLRDPLPLGHDIAWLSQILHSNGAEDCAALITKTAAALGTGGLLLIHEFFLDESMAGPLFPALFSLNMLLGNDGRSYSEQEIREMMIAAGVRDIVRLPFRGPNDSGILQGVVA